MPKTKPVCRVCGNTFSRPDSLNRHYRNIHHLEPTNVESNLHPYTRLPDAPPWSQPPAWDPTWNNSWWTQPATWDPTSNNSWMPWQLDTACFVPPSTHPIDAQAVDDPMDLPAGPSMGPPSTPSHLNQAGPSTFYPTRPDSTSPRQDRKNSVQCHVCQKFFSRVSNLKAHIREIHNGEKRVRRRESSSNDESSPSSVPESSIPESSVAESNNSYFADISESSQSSLEYWEKRGERVANWVEDFRRHRHYPDLSHGNIFSETVSAFDQMLSEHTATVNSELIPELFLPHVRPDVEELLHHLLARFEPIKDQVVLHVNFFKL